MPSVVGAAAAFPEVRLAQEQALETSLRFFGLSPGASRHEDLFRRTGVGSRSVVEQPAYYLAKPGFEARNKDYLKHALKLGARAAGEALARAGLAFKDVSHVISVTTTGLLTPSLEARLAAELPLRRSVKRTPIFGVGCAGGAVALARAGDLLKGSPGETALVLSVELCSLTLHPGDASVRQWIAAALFGDGAAAVVVRGGDEGPGVRIAGSGSVLWPEAAGAMGWDFTADGMRLVLSTEVPRLAEREFGPAVESFLAGYGLSLGRIHSFILHPGSAKVLDACEKALGLSARDTARSRRLLERRGNLSSASVLVLLAEALEDPPPPGSFVLLASPGPGFALEMVLLRFG